MSSEMEVLAPAETSGQAEPRRRNKQTIAGPSHAERARISAAFLERERLRGRPSVRSGTDTLEPTRKRPTRAVDGDVKMWVSRGYSLEIATAMAEQQPSVPSAWATRYGGDLA